MAGRRVAIHGSANTTAANTPQVWDELAESPIARNVESRANFTQRSPVPVPAAGPQLGAAGYFREIAALLPRRRQAQPGHPVVERLHRHRHPAGFVAAGHRTTDRRPDDGIEITRAHHRIRWCDCACAELRADPLLNVGRTHRGGGDAGPGAQRDDTSGGQGQRLPHAAKSYRRTRSRPVTRTGDSRLVQSTKSVTLCI